jgi:signal transduction histidine kinase/DNA-binding response OmpR family regulator/CHASE3 domain sensor protein
MSNTTPGVASLRKAGADPMALFGLTVIILFFLASGVISYRNIQALDDANQEILKSYEMLSALDDVLSTMKDAETGQRGFILTGAERYLEPYNEALSTIGAQMNRARQHAGGDQEQLDTLRQMQGHIDAKLAELKTTIDIRRNKGIDAALTEILTDRGKIQMDDIRTEVSAMNDVAHLKRARRLEEMGAARKIAIISGLASAILGMFISIVVAMLLRRVSLARRRQEWLRVGQAELNAVMLGDQRVQQLGDNILKFLAEYFGAQAGAMFVRDESVFRRAGSYGMAADSDVVEQFLLGEGLLGQAARDSHTFILRDVPKGYLKIKSALGEDKPNHLVIAPSVSDGSVNSVLELGFIHDVDETILELLSLASESIGIAVRSANYRAELQNFLEETQRQSEELQAQSEELRVSNEELEEQSRALKETQTRLEQQQAELEQTNTQLEEQAQQLEVQRDDLSRANAVVQLKAQELEQASRYKSDFLANMSHELRTPLNSSLILAKLLADNPEENLTEEQVKYAETIQSSGNDLLNLINDILDLSKIEAGHMDIRPETMSVKQMADNLTKLFRPLADQKGLELAVEIAQGMSDFIESDRQRLEQVLKNLLSNAFKFTERGSVRFIARPMGNDVVAFSVIDTGIGISQEQQPAIFDAFRQADSTISRKYGGTGLGLSISRELTRLLGGSITMESAPGKGSIFTVILPVVYDATSIHGRQETLLIASPEKRMTHQSSPAADMSQPAHRAAVPRAGSMLQDDRSKLSGSKRVLLVVEDDPTFADILFKLAHELGFECLIAHTAADALAAAKDYAPSAVVLDVGLPDNSGLSVLDRLKRDVKTRHIPVHVISAGDHAETALSLGAVGYLLKPVKREELTDVLKQLEQKLMQGMRRVLIVEDDDVQRDAVARLLKSHDVETVPVGTAAECLERLKKETFDCMVLDLSLPDASGYSLLETLSQEDAYSFPPVIVYTGKDISAAEEQRLRRYSKSIIIKGAKSPERLLDEVSLFLHRVVSELPPEQQKMIRLARNRDALLEGRRILIVEDDVRNVYSLTNILEPRGASIQIARNGQEALDALVRSGEKAEDKIDLVLMDVMMPIMDGLTATREIRKNPGWKKLPVIMLTAKAMRDDQERCLEAGANDYMAKPLDVEKLLSLVRVWMPR